MKYLLLRAGVVVDLNFKDEKCMSSLSSLCHILAVFGKSIFLANEINFWKVHEITVPCLLQVSKELTAK